jgi:hypothetical protein
MKQIAHYKSKAALWQFIIIVALLYSCKKMDGYNDPVSTDTTKPDVVTNVRVVNYNGGAHIIYTLPTSPNILYVQAEYEIRPGVKRQAKSSYYSDTITVDGFAKKGAYNVTLYTVSRANIKSDSVTVKVTPDTPYYQLAFNTASLTPDFGGVSVQVANPSRQPLGLIMVKLDSATHTYEIEDQHYAASDTINFSLRGYDTTGKSFGVYILDQWGNISDTLIKTIKPLYETQLDKGKFFKYQLPTDTEIGYGWDVPYLWDGKTDGSSNGWHTNPGGVQPMVCTFGLGVDAKLSRFVLYERPDQYAYSHGNPRYFSMWGSEKTSPADSKLPANAAEGTVVGDWVNLGNYKYPDPPSGYPPGLTTAADEAFVRAGVNFNIPLASPKTRYIRFNVSVTWSGGDFAHAMELTFFGDNR